jgi:hypothetical protein
MSSHAQAQHSSPWIVFGLIGLGVVSRLVPHPWNATPVMAIALFAGTYLPGRWGVLAPLGIVAISDLAFGWHNTIPFTWGAFALTGLLGGWIQRRPSAGRIVTASLTGSVLFFLITNFGVWAVGELYPSTAAGFWQCYVAALPFFRGTLLGDLVYTAAFFGGYALIMRSRLACSPACPSPSERRAGVRSG